RRTCDPPSTMATEDSIRYDHSAGTALGLAGGSNGPIGMPIDQRYEGPVARTYTTLALERDLEVTGQPRILLNVSSTAKVAAFVAKLCDVSPDGTAVMVSRWSMNATHRESDSDPSFLKAGEIYELKFDLWATSYLFAKSH